MLHMKVKSISEIKAEMVGFSYEQKQKYLESLTSEEKKKYQRYMQDREASHENMVVFSSTMSLTSAPAFPRVVATANLRNTFHTDISNGEEINPSSSGKSRPKSV